MMNTARGVFASHGLVENPDKTEGPAQSITFLGLGIDSISQRLYVPSDKVEELLQLSGDMASRNTTRLRHLQSLVGKFSFVASVLPGARPFFRRLIDATKRQTRKRPIPITHDMQEDLRTWAVFLKQWNGQERWVKSPQFVLGHDASGEGFGFLLEKTPSGFDVNSLPWYLRPGMAFAGFYSAEHLEDASRSIQWGEMLAMAASLAIYAPFLRDSSVLLRTDNIADMHIIRRQSTKSLPLLALLRSIYATCAHYNIDIDVEHVPGRLNTVPDYLSRPELHQCRACLARDGSTFNIHFIHSSFFRPGKEAHLPSTFCWDL